MIEGGIDAVNPNGVDRQVLKEWYITGTSRSISKRISEGGRLRKRRVGIIGDSTC